MDFNELGGDLKYSETIFDKINNFEYSLIYSNKNKRFHVIIPAQYLDKVELKPLDKYASKCYGRSMYSWKWGWSGETEIEVYQNMINFLKEYVKLGTKTEFVISIKVDSTESWNDRNFIKDAVKDRYKQGNGATDFQYSVYRKITVGENVRYKHLRYDNDCTRDCEDSIIIPFTRKNYRFCKKMTRAIIEVNDKIKKYLGTPEKILKAINQNIKLIETEGE